MITNNMKTTCQICEREIKANIGVIAHHGYQRPDRGSGWQTESCVGARHLPYEKSCDVIQPTIDYIETFIKNQSSRLRDIVKNPPKMLSERMMFAGSKEYPKPEDFDPNKCLDAGTWNYNERYGSEFRSMYRDIERSISNSRYDVKRLTKRLAEWEIQ